MTVLPNTLLEYSAVLVYMIFYIIYTTATRFASRMAYYIMPFEICKTSIVFPEVYIHAIVEKYLVPIGSYR